ncbi:uncharacterized protein EV420DRAFT_1500997 [Desarmillaria tabescens]|uniref:Uncharacterized protein n=1 Tax=Armillaria tabescens TaxID=1929756 RepID=A0AA39T6G5_ARMTA|nr:uncharacterized protein EV420DRAFT_1500997 [Desarmillaria tabescens]KAK0467711.1 hypothetical protein EV420DRAFT_1500997 [Desarmillaria tabescens]
MSQPIPPFSLSNFDHLSSTSMPHEDPEPTLTPAAGFELIVWGLDRSSQLSAQSDFAATYEEVFENSLTSQTYLPSPADIVVVPGDAFRAVDYVFVSLSPSLSPHPRPDILNSMKHAILAHGNKAEWKVARGYDRTRRGFFKMDDMEDVERMKDKIADALNTMGLTFQFHTIITCGRFTRVAFDFIDAASIEYLESTPLVIDQRVLPISRPRYIVPMFGYDVVITGCSGIQGIRRAMNAIIRNLFGPDTIAHSRMELDGDAYVVVMNNFVNAARLIKSNLPLPNGIPPFVPISKPMDLSLYNLRGCPACPGDLDGETLSATPISIRNLQRQIHRLQELFLHVDQAAQSALHAQTRVLEEVHQSSVTFQNALSMSVAIQVATQHLCSVESELTLLRHERSSKELLALVATDEEVKRLIEAQISELDKRIEIQDNLRTEATAEYRLAMDRMVAFATPSPEAGHG